MTPFFDIGNERQAAENVFQLAHMGKERIILTTVARRGSEYWGTTGRESKNYYRPTTSEDYDSQFIDKLKKWKPVYTIDNLLEHHYKHYIDSQPATDDFLKHMRYIILPKIRPSSDTSSLSNLFEKWLHLHEPTSEAQSKINMVNHNTINVGSINAPTQLQQNSDHSIQIQNDHPQKQIIDDTFELLKKDIQNVNEQIRKDFAMEMDYAITQLAKDKDIKPQLLNIGTLIKDVGMGTFTNLLAAPIFELIKPLLGLH